ncbi:Hypp7835 [Branchiostoma lanceolatum]|uniref:Hypp7835 protein n=1 Tax=Branchiostoma lanceolatum TaxID=7740 RepID=A0A8J9Z3T8_BRALA|nr:Hypp7835 [Branchiostoma lanceolatum]
MNGYPKLVLLLIALVVMMPEGADAGVLRCVPCCPPCLTEHDVDNTHAAAERKPRDLAADVPQVNDVVDEKAESFIERLAKREKTP